MPTLRCFFAIYTDGGSPTDSFDPPPGVDVFFGEMGEIFKPVNGDQLFGPHVGPFNRFKPKRGFLLGFSRTVRGPSTPFFVDVRQALLDAVDGVKGYSLDVLRLWPFPLSEAANALPDDPLPEDLFSVGFTDMGDHGYRAETFGLAKLGQREVSFAFQGKPLLDEAALMCGHLADWVMDHPARVEHGQSMAFGFERIVFHAAEGADAGGPLRGWHPPVMQQLLPETIFPGVGALEVFAQLGEPRSERHDLTLPLQRALEQRLVLEEYDVTGDAPYAATTARVRGAVHELRSLSAWRTEPEKANDSGWSFSSRVVGDGLEPGVVSLGDLAHQMPDLVRFLALPPGVRMEWNADGALQVDTSKVQATGGDDDSADDD
ncbi:MAG: hypothetical protein JNG84_08990 [Archangium sp.]|nr:hypothetical protein [Archangium sp.]